MTAAEALQHPWLAQAAQPQQPTVQPQEQTAPMEMDHPDHEQRGHQGEMVGVIPHDLLPNMKARMKARTKFRNAVQAVKAINKMRGVQDELRPVHSEEVSHVLHREDEDMV